MYLYLVVYTIAQSRTIPAQSPFFTAQFASQNPHNFLFFLAPVFVLTNDYLLQPV